MTQINEALHILNKNGIPYGFIGEESFDSTLNLPINEIDRLRQNYLNPFNPSTNINYDLRNKPW